MKKVKFLRDFRGILTGEQYRQVGQTMELPDDFAKELVKQGVVELVKAKAKKPAKVSEVNDGRKH